MYKTLTFEFNNDLKTFVQIQESLFDNIEDATNNLNHLTWSSTKNKLTSNEHRNQMDQKYGYNKWEYQQSHRNKKSKAKVVSVVQKSSQKVLMYTTLVEIKDNRERSHYIQDQIFNKITKQLNEDIQKQIDKDNPFKITN